MNSIKAIQRKKKKAAETTGELIGNKSTDKITKLSRSSPQNNSETVKSNRIKDDLIEKYQKKNLSLQKKKDELKWNIIYSSRVYVTIVMHIYMVKEL